MKSRPDPGEYAPYYEKYVSLVPEAGIVSTLNSTIENTVSILGGLTEEKATKAYAEGKWTIKQVLGHVIDSERVFAYRALRIGRNDKTPLPGFEQDDYVASTNFNARPLSTLLEEWVAVRDSGIHLFKHFSDEEWLRRGTANQKEITVRALAYIIAGHHLHHVNIVTTRYL